MSVLGKVHCLSVRQRQYFVSVVFSLIWRSSLENRMPCSLGCCCHVGLISISLHESTKVVGCLVDMVEVAKNNKPLSYVPRHQRSVREAAIGNDLSETNCNNRTGLVLRHQSHVDHRYNRSLLKTTINGTLTAFRHLFCYT